MYGSTMASKQCRDCKVELTSINILDQLGGATPLSGLAYTTGEAGARSAWSGKVKNQAGVVNAWMCDRCLRVEFYAQPG
jgi:hypothetical protein